MRIKYLKMISYLSLIFLTANFILCMNYLKCINGWAFLWMLTVIAVVCSEVQMNRILRIICGIMIFVPVFFSQGVTYKLSIAIVGGILIYSHKKFVLEINYDQILYQIKIMFPVAIGFILVALMAVDSEKVNEYIIPYGILYLIFSIVLLRTMRNYKYNVVNKKIRKINTVYLIIIMAFSAGISIKQIRALISSGFGLVYKGVAFVLYKAATYISFYMFKLFNKFKLSKETEEKFFSLYKTVFGGPAEEKQNIPVEQESQTFWAQHGVSVIINIIIVCVAIYLVYKFINVQYNKKKETSEFVEKREAIKINENKERQKTSFYDKLKKGSYKDKIRYYYYRFLRDCRKSNIEIAASDTTKDVNDKAVSSFKKDCLQNIREIYLKAKYTEKECTAEDFNDFHKSYKEK